MKVIIAYIPVLHRGYLEFLQNNKDAKFIFVINSELAVELDASLKKDIRAVNSSDIVTMLSSIFADTTAVYDISSAGYIKDDYSVVMPDEDVSRAFAKKFLDGKDVEYSNVFLRWDKSSSTKKDEVAETCVVSQDDFDRKVMRDCHLESHKSRDWWRSVGGCIVKNGNVLLSPIHNEHVPSSNQPYYDGDPRSSFHKGENIELGTAMHVELSLIAKAAETGISLVGASMYVTTFPCPWCAKAIAYSGVSKLYFDEGYSVLDAQSILNQNDVEIIRVVN